VSKALTAIIHYRIVGEHLEMRDTGGALRLLAQHREEK
tara:strand:+ start:31531 stop:31644 length:114 start_codon:yes stop_codon:yes gene_type:complete